MPAACLTAVRIDRLSGWPIEPDAESLP